MNPYRCTGSSADEIQRNPTALQHTGSFDWMMHNFYLVKIFLNCPSKQALKIA